MLLLLRRWRVTAKLATRLLTAVAPLGLLRLLGRCSPTSTVGVGSSTLLRRGELRCETHVGVFG